MEKQISDSAQQTTPPTLVERVLTVVDGNNVDHYYTCSQPPELCCNGRKADGPCPYARQLEKDQFPPAE